MRKPICDGKYFIGGSREDAIGLAVSFPDLPETINVEGITLHKKSSFHITLFPVGKMVEKYHIEISDFLQKIVDDFIGFIGDNPIDIAKFRDEFRFASENELRTVVRMCDVSNIDKFYDLINEKYRLKLEHPSTHVTLYTLQPDKGIYLTDHEELEKLSVSIKNPGIDGK